MSIEESHKGAGTVEAPRAELNTSSWTKNRCLQFPNPLQKALPIEMVAEVGFNLCWVGDRAVIYNLQLVSLFDFP